MLNGWEIVGILLIVLVLFGAKKLPELAKGLGQGIREFKKSSREVQEEIESAIDVHAPPPPPAQKRLTSETQHRVQDAELGSSPGNPAQPSPGSTDSKA